MKRRVAPQALSRFKDRVREITRRVVGQSLAHVCERLRVYMVGWRGYFRLADTPRVFADIDGWIRHRLRALQLKQWKRGTTIYRELYARGLSANAARQVAANGRRWWRNSSMTINVALPNKLFEGMGLPRLAP